MKRTSAIAVLILLAVLGAAAYVLLVTRLEAPQPAQTPTTPTTPTPTPTPRTTPRQETPTPTPGRVIVKNPKGSGTNPNLTFDPQTVKVKINVNNTVVWVNEDDVVHAVVARDGSFNYPSISPGGSASFTFNRAGRFDYYCNLHPWMTGTVVVVP
ncbi:MAG: cupredoxin domain-containing protein [Thaumarchaeota archaeon]|nr:cupredoxin domain-containing protein [Candidatus Calditenuaceae archaeon]MDW8042052.1 cupredoxin domain-containing protein [Nitrososphaerota archaeon]